MLALTGTGMPEKLGIKYQTTAINVKNELNQTTLQFIWNVFVIIFYDNQKKQVNARSFTISYSIWPTQVENCIGLGF